MSESIKTRCFYACIFTVLFSVEIIIGLYVHDNFIRPYVGDMLVVIVLYVFIRIFIPEGYRLLPLWVFLFAAFVEVLQYFELARRLGLENNRLMMAVLGSTFDVMDILCYAAGCIIIAAAGYLARKGASYGKQVK